MNINFEYYRIFYYVAKYSNFTKAAHALGNSQPNITRAMNCLESAAQCTLFIRTNRGVRLTPEGERLYTRVAAAISILQTAEDEMMEYADLEHGSIAIGASETALNIYLLKKLKRFHMEYPGIRIKIYNHSTPQAVQSVKSGEIDFAVVTTPTTAKEPLREVKLQAFSEILVGGKTFTALGSQELSLAEILNYPFICLGRETMTYQFYYQFFMAHGLEMKLDTEAATTDQILPLVKAELGLAFIPQPMAEQAIRRHEIVQICLNEEIPRRDICMVYDVKRPMSVAAKKLIKILLEERDNLDGEN